MKAAPFEYVRAATVAEACNLLATDDDARIIAGGQTLVPMMAMRLARPSRLVDVGRIPELEFIRLDNDRLVIGAVTRQAAAERSALVAAKVPLLSRALPWVGHTATRSRGTIGGSIANADPAAEIALVLATLGGDVEFETTQGRQTLPCGEFLQGPMTTALPADGCVTAVRFPVWPHARIGAALSEISARHGDFAYASAAAQVAIDADGVCVACVIGVGGATPTPTRLRASEQIVGAAIDEAIVRKILAAEIDTIEIMSDPHASVAYRRRASLTLATRAVMAARDEALSRGDVA